MKSRIFKKAVVYILFCLFFIPCLAFSGEFRVTPIRLDFDRGTKSGVVTIVNEGGDKLNVQMKAFEWTQNADGKDQYTEANDIIFFVTFFGFLFNSFLYSSENCFSPKLCACFECSNS